MTEYGARIWGIVAFMVLSLFFCYQVIVASVQGFKSDCAKRNITSIDDEDDKKLMYEIASNYSIFKFVAKGILKSDVKSKAEEEKRKEYIKKYSEIQKKHKEEIDLFSSLNKYSDKIGHEKRWAYYSSQYATAINEINAINNLNSAIVSSAFQREHDSSILGGIADGIAGPGAGVATYLSTEAKNAEIRAQNRENATYAAKLTANNNRAIASTKREADRLYAKKQEIYSLMVYKKEKPKDIMNQMTIELISVTINPSGTFLIETKMKANDKVTILNKIDACIDGCIEAILYQNGKKIGVANLVLPEYGVNDKFVTVKGMSMEHADPNKSYEVKFKPKHLWKIEL